MKDKPKITIKRDKPDYNKLNEFMNGAELNPLDPVKPEQKPIPEKKEPPKKDVLPWKVKDLDLSEKKKIPPVQLPVEYVLKLQYIKEKMGVPVQETARRGIMQQVDSVLKEMGIK